MLKVSEDGKDLVCVETGRADAWWVNGWLRVRLSWAAPEDLQTLAAFIQAGPPKKRWRITRTFDERPLGISTQYGSMTLTGYDIEEV
jgi:hypothetical protein